RVEIARDEVGGEGLPLLAPQLRQARVDAIVRLGSSRHVGPRISSASRSFSPEDGTITTTTSELLAWRANSRPAANAWPASSDTRIPSLAARRRTASRAATSPTQA